VSEPPLPDGVVVRRDVVHTRLEGFRPLSLDLYLPEAGALAICVYAHGGGWRVGSRRAGPGPLDPLSGRLFGRMAAQGLAVASVDYRLSGEAHFPAQRDDVTAACRWLLDDPASEVRGLPLVTFGVSAGGQLAALCALDRGLPVRAAALWYAVTDLAALPDDLDAVGGPSDRGADSREAQLLGGRATDLLALAADASPVSYVHPAAPPLLQVHGDADNAVPVQQSRRLQQALAAAGASATLEVVPGQSHMFPGMPGSEVEALVDRSTAFLLDRATQGPTIQARAASTSA
jgi:acetyl esterase/lipase